MIKQQTTGHILKANHANQIPRYIVAVDTETLRQPINGEEGCFLHRFRLGVAISGRLEGGRLTREKRLRFTETAEFWRWLYELTAPNYTVWLVAHNLLFDLRPLGMPDEFVQARLVIDSPRSKRTREDNDTENVHCYGLAVLGSPPTILGMRSVQTNGRLVAIDTLNWLPYSLREIGSIFGLEKLQMPAFEQPDSDWFTYCERDTEITMKAICEVVGFVQENDLGNFRYTAPSQAVSCFRHRHMRHKIHMHDNAEVKRIERNGYFGGRVDCFRMGRIDEQVYYVDVNGLFPWAMRNCPVPTRLKQYELRPAMLELKPDIDWGQSIATVRLETERNIYPLRRKENTCYPIGQFDTTLAGRELQHAINNNEVKLVGSWAEYETAVVFDSYVDYMYALRRHYASNGKPQWAELCKLMLNSLYGKWGEHAPRWVKSADRLDVMPWHQWGELDYDTGEYSIYRTIGYQCFQDMGKSEKRESLVAISAFITAAARMRMNELMLRAGGKCTLYIGVDGLIVSETGYRNLEAAGELHPTELGKLKLVLSTTDGEIYGCSNYRLGAKIILAGAWASSSELSSGKHRSLQMSGERELFNPTTYGVTIERSVERQFGGGYSKGLLMPGGEVKPLFIWADDSIQRSVPDSNARN